MGQKDLSKKQCLADSERYADLINGLYFDGKRKISSSDLQEVDTQSTWVVVGRKRKRKQRKELYRDMIKRVIFGVNFAVIGIENQEEVHYLMPLRTMIYDASEYERQVTDIKRSLRKVKDLSKAEFLSHFRKADKLHPCITIVLYFGDHWDGSKELHELIDFTDIPPEIKKYVNNYSVHVVEVMKMQNTDMFQSDLKQIFDYIRFSKDKKKLKELVSTDPAYQEMDEEAYDMLMEYTRDDKLIHAKRYQGKDGKINMCVAIREMLADEKEIGKEIGKEELLSDMIHKKICKNFTIEKIAEELEEDVETIRPIYERIITRM